MPHILMCPPDYFGIEYEINPWMSRRQPSDHETALRQWQALRDLLQQAGAAVSCLEPVSGLPDMVFTANAALIYRRRAILARFRHPERQGEEPHFQAWFAEHGFAVEKLNAELFFEGAGDALFCGETLLAGYRIRSHARAYLADRRHAPLRDDSAGVGAAALLPSGHLLLPLAPGLAVYYPPAFDEYGQKVLRDIVPELIAVGEMEARQFACNAVVVGRTVITNSGCPELHRRLGERGFQPVETPLSEYLRAGGAAKCLTLRLDGEEAAAWKQGL